MDFGNPRETGVYTVLGEGGLELRAREAHQLKVPVALEWVPLLPMVATTTKYPQDLVLGVVAALHVVKGQVVVAMAMAMATFLSGNSTSTLQQSRRSSGILTRALATGGGTQDRHIRFWNAFTGTMLNELDTARSQVCPTFPSRI